MAILSKTVASLRIIGDDLVPDEVTKLLGCEPNIKMIIGEPFSWGKQGKPRLAKSSMWRISATDQLPGDLDKQIEEMLSLLTNDLTVWSQLSKKYKIDIFCGLFMESDMEGISLSAKSMLALGERGIEIDFDMYGSCEE
jgi:hypothetical protein